MILLSDTQVGLAILRIIYLLLGVLIAKSATNLLFSKGEVNWNTLLRFISDKRVLFLFLLFLVVNGREGLLVSLFLFPQLLLSFQSKPKEEKRSSWDQLFVSGVVCFVMLKLGWWMHDMPIKEWILWAFITLTLLFVAPFFPHLLTRPSKGGVTLLLDLLAILLLVGAASQMPIRLSPSSFHHWSVFIGAVQAIRDGGWLMWSVPSQYGFLSTLAIALWPGNPWQTFFSLNALFMSVSGVISFLLLRTIYTSASGILFCLLLSWAAWFLIPGFPPSGEGPLSYPSVGAYRFCWPFFIVALLWWFEHTHCISIRVLCWLGNSLWLIGVLWSVESAFYCTMTWFPAYAVLHKGEIPLAPLTHSWKDFFLLSRQFVYPVLLFGAAVSILSLFFLLRLGHLPDYYSFFEYALSFSRGFGQTEVNFTGPVWIFILLLAAGVGYLASYGSVPNGRRVVLLASLTCTWSVASYYFISRSHDNNVSNLTPFILLTLSSISFLLEKERYHFLTFQRVVAVPTCSILITIGWVAGRPEGYFSQFAASFPFFNQKVSLPTLSTDFEQVLSVAPFSSSEAVIIGGCTLQRPGACIDLFPAQELDGPVPVKSLIPGSPASFIPLSSSRRKIYIKRFADQVRPTGMFYLQREYKSIDLLGWLPQFLDEVFVRKGSKTVERWEVISYVPKELDSQAVTTEVYEEDY